MAHKMACPIHRITKSLREDQGIELTTRKNDYFKHLPLALNEAFKAIKKKD
jgi:hypothetical protein